MLKIYILSAIPYDGGTYEPGVHEVSLAVAESLYMRGPARPATQAEIAFAEAAAADVAQRETAEATPVGERAVQSRPRSTRRAVEAAA